MSILHKHICTFRNNIIYIKYNMILYFANIRHIDNIFMLKKHFFDKNQKNIHFGRIY
jgi:hypothetical protein